MRVGVHHQQRWKADWRDWCIWAAHSAGRCCIGRGEAYIITYNNPCRSRVILDCKIRLGRKASRKFAGLGTDVEDVPASSSTFTPVFFHFDKKLTDRILILLDGYLHLRPYRIAALLPAHADKPNLSAFRPLHNPIIGMYATLPRRFFPPQFHVSFLSVYGMEIGWSAAGVGATPSVWIYMDMTFGPG
jgi:hypothetical protein